jgi:MFS transporter, DHA1 family, tetracycline resistance protein
VMGVAQSSGSLARLLGPAAAGVLFGQVGKEAPYWVGAVLVAGAVVLAIRVRNRHLAVAVPKI